MATKTKTTKKSPAAKNKKNLKQLAEAREKRKLASYTGTGRPTKMTTEILQKLEYVFMRGGSDEMACRYAEISTTTLYNFQEKYPEYVDRKRLLKSDPDLKAMETTYEALKSNPKIAFGYMKARNVDGRFSGGQGNNVVAVQVNVDNTRDKYAN